MDLKHDTNGVMSFARDLNSLLEGGGHVVTPVTPAILKPLRTPTQSLLKRIHLTTGSPGAFVALLRLTAGRVSEKIASLASCNDLVIAHDPLTAGAAAKGVAGRCQVLLFCHFAVPPWDEFADAGLVPAGSGAYHKLKRMMSEALSNPAITLVTVSEMNITRLRSFAPDRPLDKVHVVYPGVSLPPGIFRVSSVTRRPAIINVGRIEPQKNQRLLPEIARALADRGFPCDIIMVGPANPAELTQINARITELGVGEYFRYTGLLNREEVFRLMAGADLYLHTSLVESFGMTLVEAIAAGTPVMALKYDALHEILPDMPEAVIPSSETASGIAGRVAEMLGDTERLGAMAVRQHAVYNRLFSREALLSQALKLITTARSKKGGAIKILVTTIMDIDNDINGVISVTNDLNSLFTEAGHTVRNITPANGRSTLTGKVLSRLIRTTERLYRAADSRQGLPVRLIITSWGLRQRIARFSDWCDVIIAHDVISAGAAVKACGGRRPVLLFCHFWTEPWEEFTAAGMLPEETPAYRRLKLHMLQILKNQHLTLVPVSDRNLDLVSRITGETGTGRIMRVYPGFPLPRCAPRNEADANRMPLIINVGKIEQRKNQRILPLVAVELLRLGHPCRFMLVGPEEPEEKEFILARARELGVHDFFSMVGSQNRQSALTAICQADLYLHTSLRESLGLTLVEAMAAGTPVMALEYDALHELMPDTPEMIIPVDAKPADIAMRISKLLADRGRLKEIQEHQSAVFDRLFSAKAFISRIMEIITTTRGDI